MYFVLKLPFNTNQSTNLFLSVYSGLRGLFDCSFSAVFGRIAPMLFHAAVYPSEV